MSKPMASRVSEGVKPYSCGSNSRASVICRSWPLIKHIAVAAASLPTRQPPRFDSGDTINCKGRPSGGPVQLDLLGARGDDVPIGDDTDDLMIGGSGNDELDGAGQRRVDRRPRRQHAGRRHRQPRIDPLSRPQPVRRIFEPFRSRPQPS